MKNIYRLLFLLFLSFGIFLSCGNIENSNIIKFEYESDFRNIDFIKNNTLSDVEKTFTSDNFFGEFENMNLNQNVYYREEYLQILKMKKIYIAGNSEKRFDEEESSNKENFIYYFFDMNNDNIPELVVNNSPYSTDIFTFDLKSKRVKKVISLSSGAEFLGENKVYLWDGGIGSFENYFKIDNNGTFISTLIFYSAGSIDEDLYTIGAWEDSIQFNQLKMIAKENNENLYYNQLRGVYCFRITEEQSNELMKPYLEIRKKAKENIKKVTYTYDELFGELEKSKEVLLDISSWSHPTKDVFKKYGITVNKVKLIDNFPTFYITFNRKYTNKAIDKLLNELLKANGYWNFEIKDELTEKSIKIYGDKKNKKLLKYEYE